jgi:predicted DNA-binding protein (UPF0251 family)
MYESADEPLRRWDAEIAYIHLPKKIKDEIQERAQKNTRQELEDVEPDIIEMFENDLRFSFDELELIERRPPHSIGESHSLNDELLEITINNRNELDELIIRDCEETWNSDYLANIRGEVNKLQRSTSLAHREFVALVLAENPDITWARSAELMGISEGTFSGKMGEKVTPKIEEAQTTVNFVTNIRNHWSDIQTDGDES